MSKQIENKQTDTDLQQILNETKIKYADAVMENHRIQAILAHNNQFCAQLEQQIFEIQSEIKKAD